MYLLQQASQPPTKPLTKSNHITWEIPSGSGKNGNLPLNLSDETG